MSDYEDEATFKQQTVYHSWLKQASPLVLRFVTKPAESKYKSKPKWVAFRIRGDVDENGKERKYTLNLENARIEEKVANTQLKRWVKVTATGGSEDDPGSADILIEEAEGIPAMDPAGTPSHAPGRTSPPRRVEHEDIRSLVLTSTLLAMDIIAIIEADRGREPTKEEIALGQGIRITWERTDLPFVPGEVPEEEYEPSADGVGGKVTEEHINEIVRLMEQAALTDDQTKDVAEWLTTDFTMLDFQQMVDQLTKRIEQKATVPQLF